jgi:hypothetical protein
MRNTRHQTPRGTRPDAERGDTYFLIKNVSRLLPTYQIRLLTFLATEKGRKVVIKVPKHAELDEALRDFVAQNRKTLRVEKG